MSLNSELRPATSERELRALALRTDEAGRDVFASAPPQLDNGDEARYPDKSGTYTKGIKQTRLGVVDAAAYKSFKKALASGDPLDFEQIIIGGTRTQNGPQGGIAFYLGCEDADQFTSAPAPELASDAYATELIEVYWASLLRDVAFTDYPANVVAQNAAQELSSRPEYAGPRDASNKVTPELLFRGGLGTTFAGETAGPYISQFLLLPTQFGSLPIAQQYLTNKPKIDFMLDPKEFIDVQNGIDTHKKLTPGATLFLHDGRGLAAYTHDDVLYEAYFIAYLVLSGLKAKPNQGCPYNNSKTQNGFATFGGPDIASALAAVADEALKAVWYQKWWVHLRHRPESGGGIVHLQKTGQGGTIDGHVSNVVLNSQAVQASHTAGLALNPPINSYLLAQAFPEGSPTHPSYPTGHGTVAGACITMLKFFYDGAQTIASLTAPQVPSHDGMKLNNYTGADAKTLTVNGELHKLAHNISFGHGIHAGIHWRSDTDRSMLLGEAIALSFLRDRAKTYNEQFSISLTKMDGTIKTISNP